MFEALKLVGDGLFLRDPEPLPCLAKERSSRVKDLLAGDGVPSRLDHSHNGGGPIWAVCEQTPLSPRASFPPKPLDIHSTVHSFVFREKKCAPEGPNFFF